MLRAFRDSSEWDRVFLGDLPIRSPRWVQQEWFGQVGGRTLRGSDPLPVEREEQEVGRFFSEFRFEAAEWNHFGPPLVRKALSESLDGGSLVWEQGGQRNSPSGAFRRWMANFFRGRP